VTCGASRIWCMRVAAKNRAAQKEERERERERERAAAWRKNNVSRTRH